MRIRTLCLAPCALTVLTAAPAFGDFEGANREYTAGHFEVAHTQFLALAELGDCTSQFNLGAMALKGQGGPVDRGSAVGWLRAAAGNGCQPLVGGKADSLAAHLSDDQQRTAADIVARYGRDALHAQGVVDPDFGCQGETTASALQTPTPEYPHLSGPRPTRALVITKLTIGVDGRARDPEIVLAIPDAAFGAAAVEAWLNSRFTPASLAGKPVESRVQAKLVFSTERSDAIGDMPALRQAHTAADAGDPAAAYLFGLAATFDPSLGIAAGRATELVLDAARDGQPEAQYWVGSQLHSTAACRGGGADGSVWLTHAAAGGNASAQLLLASTFLGGTPSEAQVQQARALLEQAAAADSYYVRKHVVALLAASPLPALRDPPTALALAVKLLAGNIQSDPQMFEAVAAAYAANGDFRNAVAQQQVALRKAQNLGWDTHAMNDRLAAYRGGKSWQGELLAPG